jgi:hypothetical protein
MLHTEELCNLYSSRGVARIVKPGGYEGLSMWIKWEHKEHTICNVENCKQ